MDLLCLQGHVGLCDSQLFYDKWTANCVSRNEQVPCSEALREQGLEGSNLKP